MQLKTFQIPASGSEEAEAERNKFLRTRRVLKGDRELVLRESSPCWAVCVEYQDSLLGGPGIGRQETGNSEKKGKYKAVLSEADFADFSRLRDVRKELAEAEGGPVYAVFANEQLARLSPLRPENKAAMEQVVGAGAPKSPPWPILKTPLMIWNSRIPAFQPLRWILLIKTILVGWTFCARILNATVACHTATLFRSGSHFEQEPGGRM